MLHIVSTPIGNLEDITLRALRILNEADFILAEDTRKTGVLLKHFKLEKKLVSFFEHNERKKTSWVIEELGKNKKIVLVSSAGTPTISDPGYCLIKECIKQKVPFSAVPGPSAIINSLVLSGLPRDKFLFLGFLPRRGGKKKRIFQEIAQHKATLIIFESPYRVLETLELIGKVLGEKEVVVAREMTKVYEETIRGTPGEIIGELKNKDIKGECVLLVDNSD